MKSTIYTKGGYELSCYLEEREGLGVFLVATKHPHITIALPEFLVCETKPLPKDWPLQFDKVITSLRREHREDLLHLSLLSMKEQFLIYQDAHFESFLTDQEEVHLLKYGPTLLKNEFNSRISGLCGALLKSLEQGLDCFYEEYCRILKRLSLSDKYARNFIANKPKDDFLDASIGQHFGEDEGGLYKTTLLQAQWLGPILKAMWLGDVKSRANKTPKLQKSNVDLLLELPTIELVANPTDEKIQQDRIWVDTAGLDSKLVEKVLQQYNKATIIDLLKLFTTLWNEHPDIQRSNIYNIPGRWSGLLEELHTRYNLSISKKNLTKVIDSCRLLEAIRWGTAWTDHEKLLAFGGRKRNQQLIVTYLEGFRNPMGDSKRLVPILDHPTGTGRSRPLLNRFGLAIGSWLVENSQAYFHSGGTGVELDEEAYKYFRQRVGFGRKSEVDKAMKQFEEYGAIQLQSGLLGLGEKNNEGKTLILDGAKMEISGREGGKISRRKVKK